MQHIFKWFHFRLTCKRFAQILFRGGSTYRNCLLEEIIFDFNLMSKKLDPREQLWPIGQISKISLVGQPLDQLEVFCNISKGILKQETVSSHNLVHNSSVLNYFYNPNGIMYTPECVPETKMEPTERLMFLMEVTLQVYNENRNLMYCTEEKNTLDHLLECVIAGATTICSNQNANLGYNKLQGFIEQCNQNGDSILHVLAKKGNNF